MVETTDATNALEGLTRAQLKDILDGMNVSYRAKATKAELLALVYANQINEC